jgi:hypothetical protein
MAQRRVMGKQSGGKIVRLADVEPANRVLEDANAKHERYYRQKMAPETGLEPVTRRLTAGCSTIELLWNPEERKH